MTPAGRVTATWTAPTPLGPGFATVNETLNSAPTTADVGPCNATPTSASESISSAPSPLLFARLASLSDMTRAEIEFEPATSLRNVRFTARVAPPGTSPSSQKILPAPLVHDPPIT